MEYRLISKAELDFILEAHFKEKYVTRFWESLPSIEIEVVKDVCEHIYKHGESGNYCVYGKHWLKHGKTHAEHKPDCLVVKAQRILEALKEVK